MPIKVTDFEWNQKELSILLKFGLKNYVAKNVSIICTSSYIKVNFNPYIFEAFLCHEIDPEQSSSVIKEGTLHFYLIKTSKQNWDSLTINPNKNEAKNLRSKALKEFEEIEKRKQISVVEAKRTLEQKAVSHQIILNQEKFEQKQRHIKEEKSKFFKEGNSNFASKEETRRRLSSTCSEEGSGVTSEGDYDGDEESLYYSSCENLSEKGEKDQDLGKDGKAPIKKHIKNDDSNPIIRKSCSLKTRHTQYKRGIPKRESISQLEQLGEERVEGEKKESKIHEEIEALKLHATKCFENQEYEGAVNAYTKAIKLSPFNAVNYSNRAAGYIALKGYDKAVQDCSKALQLLNPPSEGNEKSRLLCLIRRGTSYAYLHSFKKGLKDYESALQLDPDNATLKKDVAAMRAFSITSSDTDETDNLSSCSEDCLTYISRNCKEKD